MIAAMLLLFFVPVKGQQKGIQGNFAYFTAFSCFFFFFSHVFAYFLLFV